jgi:hypothetical protein
MRFPRITIANKRVKSFLENNEIYATTVCTVLLGTMAVFVSFSANKISYRQTEMDYFDKLPDFQILNNQIYDSKSKMFNNSTLSINKLSGKAKNIFVTTVSVLEIVYQNTNNKIKTSLYLLEGYYNSSIINDQADKLIQTEVGSDNVKQFIKLDRRIDELIETQNEFVNTQLKTYVCIKYLNFENKQEIEYFDASSTIAKTVDDKTVKDYFEHSNSIFVPAHTLVLTEDKLESNINKILSTVR